MRPLNLILKNWLQTGSELIDRFLGSNEPVLIQTAPYTFTHCDDDDSSYLWFEAHREDSGRYTLLRVTTDAKGWTYRDASRSMTGCSDKLTYSLEEAVLALKEKERDMSTWRDTKRVLRPQQTALHFSRLQQIPIAAPAA